MEPPARACSCGSPASSPGGPSDSEAEVGGPSPAPPRPERSHKRPRGPDRGSPELPPSPRGGKRPRRGEGREAPPSDGDRLFAQKCQELRGFIQPLAELLEGLKRGRYDRGLSSFQQSVAMDRIQRIIGVLQKPEMGSRYLGTLLQVEGMLRLWFPHVAPKPAQDAAPAPPRRRPPRRPPRGPPLPPPAWRHPPFLLLLLLLHRLGDITSGWPLQVPPQDPPGLPDTGCLTPPRDRGVSPGSLQLCLSGWCFLDCGH
ncbi:circadian-associated transcriptional repressor [Colius striatus]|uniref:circadian-associated transcriptional repressor n=1 Tax=Colius striatus TaxID=57412 RepID=UPI002B1E1806|nr:circadian-associated transcriptional repressor [Colius striatus]